MTHREHPGADQLGRFLAEEASPEERRTVVRHLLTGCPACVHATREAWSQIEAFAGGAEDRKKGRNPRARRGDFSSWRDHLMAQAKEAEARAELRRLIADLESLRFRLIGIQATIPPSPLELGTVDLPDLSDAAIDLRTGIANVLNDRIYPALEDLERLAAQLSREGRR